MSIIDKNLSEFASSEVRRKIYAAAALIQSVILAFSGALASNAALNGKLAEWPLLLVALSGLGIIISSLAKANVNESYDVEVDDVDYDEDVYVEELSPHEFSD